MDEEQFAPPKNHNAIALLRDKLEEGAKLAALVNRLDTELKVAKSAYHTIRTETLPEIMRDIGVEKMRVAGWDAELDDLVEGSWPKDSVARVAAESYLKELGASDLLTIKVNLEFPRDHVERAREAMTLLRTAGYAPVYETNVHHATLKAFAKERLRMVQEALQAGRATAAFAGEKLGLFICKAVKFKKVK